jgi:hypothetical protein
VYAYSNNYLVDLKHAVIMDVEATTAIRQAEVGAAKTMLDRTADQFDVHPSRLIADAGYGSAESHSIPSVRLSLLSNGPQPAQSTVVPARAGIKSRP